MSLMDERTPSARPRRLGRVLVNLSLSLIHI